MGEGYLRTYAHCNRNGSGVSIMLLNIASNTTFTLTGAQGLQGLGGGVPLTPRDEYVSASFLCLSLSARAHARAARVHMHPHEHASSN